MNKHKLKNIILISVVVVAIGFGAFFYYRFQKLQKNTPDFVKQESEELLSKVSRLYLVPKQEVPTIATVSDPEKLKDQTFFLESQKGDKVLIFSQAGKAVLYRPSIDKIITVAPFNTDTSKTQNTQPTNVTTETKTTTKSDKKN